MKRIFLLCLCYLSFSLGAQDLKIYTADVYSLESLWGLEAHNGPKLDEFEGGLQLGFGVSDAFWPGSSFRVKGFYRSLNTLGSSFGLGQGFHLGGPFIILGYVGGGLEWFWNEAGDTIGPVPFWLSGVEFGLHLTQRNFLRLSLTASGQLAPRWTLGLSYSHEVPVLVPLPRAKTQIRVANALFTPDADEDSDVLKMEIAMENPAALVSWNLDIFDPQGALFYSLEGVGAPPELLEWSGYSQQGELVASASDYTLVLKTKDRLNRFEELKADIAVGILVIKTGDEYKIRIPSIIFPANSSDYERLSKDFLLEGNREVLTTLAQIFDKFPTYRIEIEGHANGTQWRDPVKAKQEQERELLPLSLKRAESVKNALITLGIKAERLSTKGFGGSRPLVQFSDVANSWKNRRVEFNLKK